MPWLATALQDLDDNHATAAARTSWLALIDGGSGGLAFRFCSGEQFARAGAIEEIRRRGQVFRAEAMQPPLARRFAPARMPDFVKQRLQLDGVEVPAAPVEIQSRLEIPAEVNVILEHDRVASAALQKGSPDLAMAEY